MLKWALALAAVMLLPACSNRTEQAQQILQSRLGEKTQLEFQNLQSFPGGAVCGEFRSEYTMRRSLRYRRFIVWGDSAEENPSKQDWAIFCSEDAAAALLANLGIGPVADEENSLPQIRDNLRLLQTALEHYRTDNLTLPSSKQGLAALLVAATERPLPVKFRPGGYLDTLPADPWGQPYRYERSRLGGVAQNFRLYTLGADGVPGGEGANADVGLEHLKYLDYLDD